MKDNQEWNAGSLLPQHYSTFARYHGQISPALSSTWDQHLGHYSRKRTARQWWTMGKHALHRRTDGQLHRKSSGPIVRKPRASIQRFSFLIKTATMFWNLSNRSFTSKQPVATWMASHFTGIPPQIIIAPEVLDAISEGFPDVPFFPLRRMH